MKVEIKRIDEITESLSIISQAFHDAAAAIYAFNQPYSHRRALFYSKHSKKMIFSILHICDGFRWN